MATCPNTLRSCMLLLTTLLVTCALDSAPGPTVHVVFGNHLDIGFNNIEPLIGYDNNVLNKYFNEYLPQAAAVAKAMHHHSPHGDRYIYTTHSYLLSLFLDCPLGMDLQCPNATTRDTVLDAIRAGAITWHVHPHNAQYEFYDTSLLEFSFDLTHDLDRRFGLERKDTVILRDVPGLTRASIPIFVSKGIKALSVGVNAGSAPPGVPKNTPFIWRDEASGTQILAFWHPGGYGGMRGDLALDPKEECIQAPGLQHVLCTSWRNDNSGPPEDVTEPLVIFELLRQEWGGHDPNLAKSGRDSGLGKKRHTKVFASSFDGFVDEVLKVMPSLNLPVVTDEIGDTWVFGLQSDPLKTANFRALSRLRAACLQQPSCPSDTPEFYNFSRLLLKVPEHTWGVDIKKTLHDFQDYSNTRLHDCLPPHLRPTWARGYSSSSSSNGGSSTGGSSSSDSDDSFTSGPNSAESSAGDGRESSGGVRASGVSGGVRGKDTSFDVDAPCPNYGHCIKAWNRQAAYVDWALQALPQDHWVVQAYSADLQARQQLAAVSPEQLLRGKLPLQTHPRPVPPQAEHKESASLASSAAASSSKSTQHAPSRHADSSAAGLQDWSLAHGTIEPGGMQRGLQMQQPQQLLSMHEQDPQVPSEPSTAAAAAPPPAQPPAGPAATAEGNAAAAHGVQQPASADVAQDGTLHTRAVPVTGSGVHQYWCGSWRFEVDESSGGLTSLVKFYGDGSTAGTDWARGSSSTTTSTATTATSSSGSATPSSSGRSSTTNSTSGSRKGSGVLCQLMYSAYCESSYDDVWEHYAWQNPMPWWFPLDFGKVNSSRAWDHEEHVAAKLVGLYETFSADGLQQLAMRSSLPDHLGREVGAPETLWTLITCPTGPTGQSRPDASSSSSGGSGGGSGISSSTVTTTSSSSSTMTTTSTTSSSTTTTTSSSSSSSSSHPDTTHTTHTTDTAVDAGNTDDGLQVTAVWQGKTPTRIPEALWFSFKPNPSAVDSSSWRLHKLGSSIHPHEVMLNGSRSMHAVSDQGVSVSSVDGNEILQISTWDTALVSPGHPTPFPQGITQPDMDQGVHFNLVNNVWGTNYVMWVPYSTEDRSMAFRFTLQARQRHVPIQVS